MNAQIEFESKPENHFSSTPVFNELCSEANDIVSELQINQGEKSENKLPARKRLNIDFFKLFNNYNFESYIVFYNSFFFNNRIFY